ncbi:hypothetical protein PQJ75_08535 [Rhodoplanes sp. TEM]|uniref:Uncharacterized protein n=1 Tax=Rhodoplanes tepidamans TaxID=200616 RepID=A0ABT5JAQ8_RHOTP|nr:MULTISPECIES: hypothetical protein [Rhodoplanes]MDC7786766.1 hypothetical protein [Rhodoplanes tepidamans]MDC7983772.1 hypothetical protein [Rhodoplanes sp. TEM]MDQ0358204.1 hypothetical protein [Rhodoplanes tepidamans]
MSRLFRVSTFRGFLHGLRTEGASSLVRLARNELAEPRLALTRKVRAAATAVGDHFRRATTASAAWSDDCLQLVWDLAAAPVSFDFAATLAAAEIERRKRGLAGIVVIVVPGPHHGVKRETPAHEAVEDPETRLWRLRHELLPMLALLPSVRGHAVCGDRRQAWSLIAEDDRKVYPDGYRVFLPARPEVAAAREEARRAGTVWPLLTASSAGRRAAEEYLSRIADGRRAVVITLRASPLSPRRNSRIDDWIAFAHGLDRDRYVPVFVHDGPPGTAAPAGLADHPVCTAAGLDIEFRMGLYERAWLNMGVLSEPLTLAWYNERARYQVFVPLDAETDVTARALEDAGHRIGGDIEFARPWQQLVWKTDELAAIRLAFAVMEQRLAAIEAVERTDPATLVR